MGMGGHPFASSLGDRHPHLPDGTLTPHLETDTLTLGVAALTSRTNTWLRIVPVSE